MKRLSYPIPTTGATMLCRFPYDERPYEPGGVLRPCIVIDPCQPTDVGAYVRVAYGAYIEKTANAGSDLSIESAQDMKACGLDEPTRFSIQRTALIPMDRRFLNLKRRFILGALPSWRMSEFQELLEEMGLRPRRRRSAA